MVLKLINLKDKRNRRLYLFFVCLICITFVIINVQSGILLFAVKAGLSPLRQNTLFPLTYFLAILSLFISLYWFRGDGILSIPNSIGVPFLWVTIFEVLWQNSFILTGKFGDDVSSELILLSWLLMGTISFPKWETDTRTRLTFLVFIIGWVAWLATGYSQMPSIEGYVFNISLKIWAFVVIIFLVMPKYSTSQTKSKNAWIGN